MSIFGIQLNQTPIGNILILRGNITIEPPGRQTVSYEHLCQLVAEYLLLNCPDVDISAALSIMPYTQSTFLLTPTRVLFIDSVGRGHGPKPVVYSINVVSDRCW